MGRWVESVEAKARIIHDQLASARSIAIQNGADADNISRPYLDILESLYSEEYPFAQLADSSDLIARFLGPAVEHVDPTVTIVAGVFTSLRDQIRQIAKSIVGLSDGQRLRWPSELDPHLSGLAHGSLVVGISIPRPIERLESGQQVMPEVSEQIFESVRAAVRSLPAIARYVGDQDVSEEIRSAFPDPAVRDTVMVAASRLAPTGRKGIESVSLYGADDDGAVGILTTASRRVLRQALSKPVKVSAEGTFEGTVREIDLDARRFEIRRVHGAGSIRCVYNPDQDQLVREILDATISVKGRYETLADQQPRLVSVQEIKVTRRPEKQLGIGLDGDL